MRLADILLDAADDGEVRQSQHPRRLVRDLRHRHYVARSDPAVGDAPRRRRNFRPRLSTKRGASTSLSYPGAELAGRARLESRGRWPGPRPVAPAVKASD